MRGAPCSAQGVYTSMQSRRPAPLRLRITVYLALYIVVVAILWLLFQPTIGAPAHLAPADANTGTVAITRTYYLAADEVTWDYTPAQHNVITNKPFSAAAGLYTQTTDRQIGSVYRKAQYREYT